MKLVIFALCVSAGLSANVNRDVALRGTYRGPKDADCNADDLEGCKALKALAKYVEENYEGGFDEFFSNYEGQTPEEASDEFYEELQEEEGMKLGTKKTLRKQFWQAKRIFDAKGDFLSAASKEKLEIAVLGIKTTINAASAMVPDDVGDALQAFCGEPLDKLMNIIKGENSCKSIADGYSQFQQSVFKEVGKLHNSSVFKKLKSAFQAVADGASVVCRLVPPPDEDEKEE
jgi:hypothetical protein